jgi:hypothetical protein
MARAAALGVALGGIACNPFKPRLERVLLSPVAANIAVGGRQEFRAAGLMSDGRVVAVPVTFTATGGQVTGDGSFTAGDTTGTYKIIAALQGGSLADTAEITVTPTTARNYTTVFPLTENPISDSGRWVGGGSVGRDWTDVSTSPGLAIGHQVGASFTDATAILTGDWGPNQRVTARVFTTRQNDECYQEVEMRLRSTVAPSRITGYEISYKASQGPEAYLIIVRWNGPLGDFTYLYNTRGDRFGLRSGDVVSARIVGNVITAYKNGQTMARVTDETFTSGNPGIGFNLVNKLPACRGTNSDYGFTSFTATDFIPR